MTQTRFTVYCHTNRVNGKRYVGQTVFTMEKRWGDHVSLAKSGNRVSQVLAKAIRKYGADAFDHQVLEIVLNQKDADSSESRWIEQLNCRVPNGYNLKSGGSRHGHHGDTKKLIGKSLRSRWQKMTSEERSIAKRPMAETLRAWWRKMTPEEYGVAISRRSEGLRARWLKMTTGERSLVQIARQKTVSPEQRSATIEKSWKTRRAKYGQSGVKRARSPKEYSESIKIGWAAMSSEARAERIQKIKDGVRKAREAKTPRLMRINLLRAS